MPMRATLAPKDLALPGDEQRESGFAGTGSDDKQVLPADGRFGDLADHHRVHAEVGETFGDGFQCEFDAADADEEDLAGVSDEIHKCVDLRLVHMVEHVGELLHDDPLAVAE